MLFMNVKFNLPNNTMKSHHSNENSSILDKIVIVENWDFHIAFLRIFYSKTWGI